MSGSVDPLAEANALNQQAITLYRQGRYAEAEPPYERALAIREKALGPNHRDVGTSLNNLAGLYKAQGRYVEAELRYKRALAIYEKALGPNDPYVAGSLNNLGSLYQDQDRYAEAEPPLKRGLAIREKALGPDHPSVTGSLNNLASLYRAQGRYAEAEALHKRALAIREKALGPNHQDVSTSLNNLASLYQDQGRYAEAEPAFKRALAIRERALGPDHRDVGTSLNNLALLYRDQGRYVEAEPLLKRALVTWDKAVGPEHPFVADALNNLAGLYGVQGRSAEAEPLYRRALAIRETALGLDHHLVGRSLNNLACLYHEQRRYAETETLLKRALAIYEKVLDRDHPYAAEALGNLASVYHEQGRYVEAKRCSKRALTTRKKALGRNHPNVAATLDTLASHYVAQRRFGKAKRLYKRALKIYEKALGPDHPDLARSLNNLAEVFRAQGRNTEALSVSARVAKILSQRLSVNFAQRGGAIDFERRADRRFFANHIVIADAVAEETPEIRNEVFLITFGTAQMAHASGAAQAVVGMAARFAIGNDALAAVVREHQDLIERWRLLDAESVKAVSRIPAARDQASESTLRASIDEVARRLDVLDAKVAVEFPNYAELINPRPLPPHIVKELLAPDEALLVFFSGEQNTWLWVIRRDGVFFTRTEIGSEALAIEVTALRARLDPEINPTLEAFPANRAYALYQKILAPAAPLVAGADHLIVVPDGALQSLPLGVLVTRPPERDPVTPDDHRGIAWLARDHAITVLPSVSSLRSLRQHAAVSKAVAPFFGIGDPVLLGPLKNENERRMRSAGLFRGNIADVEKVRHLHPLPGTSEELRAMARMMGATEDDLLLGKRACEPMIRQTALDRYKVIAFATHALVSGELEGLAEPALVLTPPDEATPENDGLLTASKIATLKLDADWVVLSACNTAAGGGPPDADGLTGLAKAFFHAGARSLLVSHWPVWSEPTIALTTRAFAELAKDPAIGRAEALRRSMMAMLDASNPPEFAHPQVWAPFVLAGEGAAGFRS